MENMMEEYTLSEDEQYLFDMEEDDRIEAVRKAIEAGFAPMDIENTLDWIDAVKSAIDRA
jgi:uncharacterized protein Smg (DUF494 family)